MKEVIPEIYLETRRVKKTGLYPVKLRIIFDRIAKYYPVNVDLSEEQFKITISCKKPPASLASKYSKIFQEKGKVIEIIKSMNEFDFSSFERRLHSKAFNTNSVKQYFNEYTRKLRETDRIGTAESYEQALNSLLKYQFEFTRTSDIKFREVMIEWLQNYERYMVKNEFSYATVGVYLRSLRSIFNIAIEEGEIDREKYPFGKRKYRIPSSSKRKKALSKEELILLLTCKPENECQLKARDFWFLSFFSNGMNISDIARLKWTDIDGDKMYFVRTKTKNTTKANQVEIIVHVNEFIKGIIEKYGNKGGSPYIFDILEPNMTEQQIKQRIKTFIRYVNQHIKNLASLSKVNSNISSVWARHSFTTSVIRMGNSLEFVQESLGHQNIKTTMSYWAGFNLDHKKEVSENLLQTMQ